ncbi:PREDICTED: major egg antigen-like [Wasmannia auropunctata]|uniref:major egg antigen-like n=1 Tax=Wasmannia auropunctata TaxID=64793 RepID=UPI0005EED2AD|nr:PREDICTED: major egg antigen-like [Wasmannia auropunctata]
MYLLPLLFLNLHLGLGALANPVDLAAGTLGKTKLALSEVSCALDPYHTLVNYNHGILNFYKPWLNLLNHNQHVVSTTSIDDDNFKITVNVQNYNPEDVTVKVVDHLVIVKAKHEEKQDESNIVTRQFVIQYLLPSRADVDQVTSSISSDGILTIIAPLKPVNEKVIQIEQTGQAAAGQAVTDQVAAGQAVTDQVAAGQAVTDQVAAGQAVTDQVAAGQAVTDQVAAGQAVTDQVAAGQAVTDQVAAGQAVAGQTAAELTSFK